MIILYFDDRYFEWAPSLIESIAINEPTERIVVFGLNLSLYQEKQIQSFRNVKSFIKMNFVETVDAKEKKYRKNGVRALLISRKAWYLIKVFYLFPNEGIYILMDADMLLLKPLTRFRSQMKNHDMAFAFKKVDGGIRNAKIAGGFLAFRPTKAVKRLVMEWDDLLADDWSKNQFSLAMLYRKHKKPIRFLYIPQEKYLDHRSRKDSIVWSAHKVEYGSKEERHNVYLEKIRRVKKKKRYGDTLFRQ